MIWTLLLALLARARPYAFVENNFAKSLIHRWKPNSVDGVLIATRGISEYTYARVHMEMCEHAAAIVDTDLNTFVVNLKYENTTILKTVLWHSICPDRTTGMRDLKKWHESHFPHATLNGDWLRVDEDRKAWRDTFEEF